ncbi:hypothetical protein LOD99_15836 [Oopsacas minuta]|uniref:Queuosine 5'-phosphate N-glycosylase/hydrolase n=1 Tax=Oopsacas minuta TaxID=111878 RepID=A0AAV7KAF3_9METZ|nr:hypothetical protein LOD99_15836 [Oopsacas minuta]
MSLPSQRVRDSAIFICSRAEHVSIQTEGVQKAADYLTSEVLSLSCNETQLGDADIDPKGSDQDRTDWIFFISALNFCFWRSDTIYLVVFRDREYSGYRGFCAAVARAVQAGIPLYRPEFYSQISEARLGELLKPEVGEIPLCMKRTQILREVGSVLCEMGGSFLPLVLSCQGSTQRLVSSVLDKFPSFRDESPSTHEPGRQVYFYKRAQILSADLWYHFKGSGPGAFHDINELTMFPDYRVPQVLYSLGAISYSPELMGIIKRGQQLEAGGKIEQELRGTSVRCVEVLKELIIARLGEVGLDKARENGWEINSVSLDYFLWRYSKRERIKVETSVPHHRIITTFY